MKGHATLMSKASDEWATPQEFFDVVNEELGRFTLDAAATFENAKVSAYMSYSMDSLRMPWAQHIVWLNPPYSRIREFMAKAAYEVTAGCHQVVCLVPARTDTKWWHTACDHAHEVRLLKGRLSFGDSGQSAPFPSALFVFYADRDKGFYETRITNWDWRAK